MLLTRDEIRATGWMSDDYNALWLDIRWIADRVHNSSGSDRAWAWHHLLLAVANFKTQAVLVPPALPIPETDPPDPEDTLEVPGATGPITLQAEDPATWPRLTKLKGLKVPRASTVLSALWPARHIIMDWRALSAALALTGTRHGWDSMPVTPDSTRPASETWDTYQWYRNTVLQAATTAGQPPASTERALWRIGDESPGTTWAQYAEEVKERLREHTTKHGQ